MRTIIQDMLRLNVNNALKSDSLNDLHNLDDLNSMNTSDTQKDVDFEQYPEYGDALEVLKLIIADLDGSRFERRFDTLINLVNIDKKYEAYFNKIYDGIDEAFVAANEMLRKIEQE
jgi:hypothetical protein